jgi:REP element-mobilizing transposase RayT
VAASVPHHVVQRGNRRQPVFFSTADYKAYLRLMATWCRQERVEVWAYCLMPNHVHLVAVPENEQGLAKAIGEAHRRYTVRVNQRENWRRYLSTEADSTDWELLRRHLRTGRPSGSPEFVESLEARTGRVLLHRKRGPKQRAPTN